MSQLAEPAVSFLLERISNFLIEEVNSFRGVPDEVQQLDSELKIMQALLKDAAPKQDESAIVKELISQSRELAYEADDLLEEFLGSWRREETANALKRIANMPNEWYMRRKVGVEIQSLKTRVLTINGRFRGLGIIALTLDKEGSSSNQRRGIKRTYSQREDDDFVGLESDVDKLVQQLVNGRMSREQRVVSIFWMGGLGKTTVARRVYNHPTVQCHFSDCVRICIYKQWQAKDILEGILIKLMPEKREEISKWRNEELVRHLFNFQQERRCLFVLDDIWEADAWEAIKPAFSLKDQGSKLLLTTRNKDVVQRIDPNGFHHELRFLNDDESWELLRKKALKRRYAEEANEDIMKMEEIGRKVAEQCGGLPLAIVVLGGILATKSSLREWETEYQKIHTNLGKGKGNRFEYEEVQKMLSPSHNDLPYQLKAYFLYLGGFPEDSEIDAETICQLWLAEDFVPMLDDAESVLTELAGRSMILVKFAEFSTSRRRRFESCRLHDLMRHLCLLKAKEENFMRVINYSNSHGNELVCSSSSSSSSLSNRVHRLFMRGNWDQYGPPEKEMTKHLRMLKLDFSEQLDIFQQRFATMDFSKQDYVYQERVARKIRSQLKNLKMLRILSIEYPEHYGGLDMLSDVLANHIRLRYLRLGGKGFSILPSSLEKLINLQTLDLRASLNIQFPDALRNLRDLKYLYLFRSMFSSKQQYKLRLDGLSKLEILENFNDAYCEAGDLLSLANLRVLTVIDCFEFDSLARIADYISCSEVLQHTSISLFSRNEISKSEKWPLVLQKLLCARSMHNLLIHGPAGKFPKYEFNSTRAAGIVKIDLQTSGICENPMGILEKLPSLRELCLDDTMVEEMVCHATGFPQLRCLDLLRCHSLRNWIVEVGAMSNLSRLALWFLPQLNKLPNELKVLKTLKDIHYVCVTKSLEEQIRALPSYSSSSST